MSMLYFLVTNLFHSMLKLLKLKLPLWKEKDPDFVTYHSDWYLGNNFFNAFTSLHQLHHQISNGTTNPFLCQQDTLPGCL
jgi:hypothetical protein